MFTRDLGEIMKLISHVSNASISIELSRVEQLKKRVALRSELADHSVDIRQHEKNMFDAKSNKYGF